MMISGPTPAASPIVIAISGAVASGSPRRPVLARWGELIDPPPPATVPARSASVRA